MFLIYDFLNDLKRNNNREWFNDHKDRYLEAKQRFEVFVSSLLLTMQELDPGLRGQTAKDAIFRIYRDVRFSADKSPYKTHFGAYMVIGGKKSGRGGYYIHLDPDGSFLAGGIHQPSTDILKRVRQEIYNFPEEFLKIIQDPIFQKDFKLMEEGKLTRAPKGFPDDFELIEMLKYKHYIASRDFPADWLFDEKAVSRITEEFGHLVNFNRFLNQAIDTTH